MAMTCLDVVNRAIGLSVANAGLVDLASTTDIQDALTRLSQMQAKAFTAYTAENKAGFLTTVTATSSAAASGRVVNCNGAAFTLKVQRIVRVALGDGTEVALVDPAVPTSELAPRYYSAGETLVEVSNDWNTASGAAVALVVTYAWRPADLDVSASATLVQGIGIPDRHADVLVYDFGAYLAEKDVGRDEQEVKDLIEKRDAALTQWVESGAQFGGVQVYTFSIPTPAQSKQ